MTTKTYRIIPLILLGLCTIGSAIIQPPLPPVSLDDTLSSETSSSNFGFNIDGSPDENFQLELATNSFEDQVKDSTEHPSDGPNTELPKATETTSSSTTATARPISTTVKPAVQEEEIFVTIPIPLEALETEPTRSPIFAFFDATEKSIQIEETTPKPIEQTTTRPTTTSTTTTSVEPLITIALPLDDIEDITSNLDEEKPEVPSSTTSDIIPSTTTSTPSTTTRPTTTTISSTTSTTASTTTTTTTIRPSPTTTRSAVKLTTESDIKSADLLKGDLHQEPKSTDENFFLKVLQPIVSRPEDDQESLQSVHHRQIGRTRKIKVLNGTLSRLSSHVRQNIVSSNLPPRTKSPIHLLLNQSLVAQQSSKFNLQPPLRENLHSGQKNFESITKTTPEIPKDALNGNLKTNFIRRRRFRQNGISRSIFSSVV